MRSVCNIVVLLSAECLSSSASAQTVLKICPRPSPGGLITAPKDVRSTNGRLELELSFQSSVESDGVMRYCYVYNGSIQAPTLRLNPGDELILTLRNDLAPVAS